MSVDSSSNLYGPGHKFNFQNSKWKSIKNKKEALTNSNELQSKSNELKSSRQGKKTSVPLTSNFNFKNESAVRNQQNPRSFIVNQVYNVKYSRKIIENFNIDFEYFSEAIINSVAGCFVSEITLKKLPSYSKGNSKKTNDFLLIEISAEKHLHSKILKMLEYQFNNIPCQDIVKMEQLFIDLIFGSSPEMTRQLPQFKNVVIKVEAQTKNNEYGDKSKFKFSTTEKDRLIRTVSLIGLKNSLDQAMSHINQSLDKFESNVSQFSFEIERSKIQKFSTNHWAQLLKNTNCSLRQNESAAKDDNNVNMSIVGQTNDLPKALAFVLGHAECLTQKSIYYQSWASKYIDDYLYSNEFKQYAHEDAEVVNYLDKFEISIHGTEIDIEYIEMHLQKYFENLDNTIFREELKGDKNLYELIKSSIASNKINELSKLTDYDIGYDSNTIYLSSPSKNEMEILSSVVHQVMQTFLSSTSVNITISEDLSKKCKMEKSKPIKAYLLQNTTLHSEELPSKNSRERHYKISGKIDEINEMTEKFEKLKTEMSELYYHSQIYYNDDRNPVFLLEGMRDHVNQAIKNLKVDFDVLADQLIIKGKKNTVDLAVNELSGYFNEINSYEKAQLEINANKKTQLASKLNTKVLIYSLSPNPDNSSKLFLTIYAEKNIKSTIDKVQKEINSLTPEETARFPVTKEAWDFIIRKPKMITSFTSMPGVFNVRREDLNNDSKSGKNLTELVLFGNKGKEFKASVDQIYEMLNNFAVESIPCSDSARKHMDHLCNRHSLNIKLPVLDNEMTKNDGLIFYYYSTPNLIIKGEKNAVTNLKTTAMNFLSSITNEINQYPVSICYAIVGKLASKKIELQSKFNVTIIVPNLSSYNIGELAQVEAIGTLTDCQCFHKYIQSNFKEIPLSFPTAMIGIICGKENKNIRDWSAKYDVKITVPGSKDTTETTIYVLGLKNHNAEDCIAEIEKFVFNNTRETIQIPEEVTKYLSRRSHETFNIKKAINPANLYFSKNNVINIVGTSEKVELGISMVRDFINSIMNGKKFNTTVPKEACGRLFGRQMKNIKKLESEHKVRIFPFDNNDNESILEVLGENETVVKAVIDILNDRVNQILHGNEAEEEEIAY